MRLLGVVPQVFFVDLASDVVGNESVQQKQRWCSERNILVADWIVGAWFDYLVTARGTIRI